MVDIVPEAVAKAASSSGDIVIPSAIIKETLINRIKKLSHNNKKTRGDLYKYFETEYAQYSPDIHQVIIEVDSSFKILTNRQLITALFAVSLFIGIFDFSTKAFEGRYDAAIVYITIGLALSSAGIILLRSNLFDQHRLEAKWITFVGLLGFLFGSFSLMASKSNLIPRNLTLNPFVFAYALSGEDMGGTAEAREQTQIQISQDSKIIKSPTLTNNISKLSDQKINSLQDDYCTVLVNSILDFSFGKIWLKSNIFRNENVHSDAMLISSISIKNLVTANVDSDGANIEGDFGNLFIYRNGDYEYKLKSTFGIGKFEKFNINVVSEKNAKLRQSLYISIVGPDYIGTESRDTIFGGMGMNRIIGMGGGDWLYGNNSDDIIDGGQGPDFIHGFGGNDVLIGGEGDDVLYGGEGNDRIDAGEGNDHIIGNEGKNTLIGGPGADRFWFMISSKDPDVIEDFSIKDGDLLEFSNIIPPLIEKTDLPKFVHTEKMPDGLMIYARKLEILTFEPVVLLRKSEEDLTSIINSNSIVFESPTNQKQ